ncbi:MAG: UDP-N-acetylglucosamine 1-carboxyvinyltransferase [Clostridiales bacterium]|nr:UDP-N-acetylglucosamine 1-carboxyvinyltransferase [Clostridiales bacterium]
MRVLRVRGGRPLSGVVAVHGAKNSVLPILAAAILAGGVSVIHNCPALTDVDAAVAILRHLGCRVCREGETVTVDSSVLTRMDIPDGLMREMRSSVIFLGAILARCGQAELSFPGGCELGPRPIDLHLNALQSMGAEIDAACGGIRCRGRLHGAELSLSLPSVGATENIMLAACAADGVTVISNAAREPEIVDLQNFLRALGADIEGAGTSTVTIRGGTPLHGGEHTVIADRIVGATYLAAAAATGGHVALEGLDRRWLLPVLDTFRQAGCTVSGGENRVELRCDRPLTGVRPIRTAPYPGFPTDAQPMVMAAFCGGRGTTVFVETIFENRYRQAAELARMGADIRVEGRVAVVCGVPRLHAARLEAADLRGGAALVVAALAAEGESQIAGLRHVDRGYARLEEDLSALGADIRRTDADTDTGKERQRETL